MTTWIIGLAATVLAIWLVEACLFYLSYKNTPASLADVAEAHSSVQPPA